MGETIRGSHPGKKKVEKNDYHSGMDRLSSSGAKEILKSPAHFMLRYGPKSKRPQPTSAMRFGTAVHMLVLEGEEKFKRNVACRPDGLNMRTKAGKAEMAAFVEATGIDPGMIFTQSDYDDMFWMRDAVANHPMACELLSEGVPEHYYQWEESASGAKCKAMADWYAPRHIVDLKTCMDASPEAFARSVYNFKYHLSAQFYLFGDEVLNHGQTKQWYWIAVEKHTNQVAVYMPDEKMELLGRREAIHAMNVFAECKMNNQWDSYSEKALELVSPSWAR